MTKGRKRRVILAVILLFLLAALWGYLSFTGRRRESPGYLVQGNGTGMENGAEYGFPEPAMSGMNDKNDGEERKDCHG